MSRIGKEIDVELVLSQIWHAHLNYACTQFFDALYGPERLLGNQLIHGFPIRRTPA